MKNLYILSLTLLMKTLFLSTVYPQAPESSVLGELIFSVKNQPAQFAVYVSISKVGMLFSGDSNPNCPQPRIYSNTYTNLIFPNGNCVADITQSIAGASHTLSNTTGTGWTLEHIGDAAPKKLNPDTGSNEWIGYGVYRIDIDALNFYTFYIDYLDSNYPYDTATGKDIIVTYDFNRTLGDRVVLSTDSGTNITSVDGKLFTVWQDLFSPLQSRAMEFFLNGNVPLSGLSSDKLFSSVIVDGDITVPSGKTFIVDPSQYPDVTRQPALTLSAETNTKLTISGTLDVKGSSANPVIFTRSGATGTWDTIKFQSSGSGTISYATIEYAQKGIWTYSDNVTVENCTIQNFTQQGVYAFYSNVTIQNSIIQNPNGASHGIYLHGTGTPTISGNTISGLSGGSIGIYRIYGHGIFSGNTIKNSTTGIQINSSSSPEIYNNYIENTTYGVRLASGSSADIHDNDFYNGSVGLYLEQSQPSDVKWNNFGWSGSIKENADEGILINYLLSGNSFLSGKKNNFL